LRQPLPIFPTLGRVEQVQNRVEKVQEIVEKVDKTGKEVPGSRSGRLETFTPRFLGIGSRCSRPDWVIL
jgi:hypothetical protein